MKKRGHNAWYGFDLDGTLAYHEPGASIHSIGEPIARTVELVKQLLADGHEVRIVTARVSPEWNDQAEQTAMIKAWCLLHFGQELEVQAHKNGAMLCLWDDRAIGVVRNTGVPLHEAHLLIDRTIAAQRVEDVFYARTGMHIDARVAEAIAAAILESPKEPT